MEKQFTSPTVKSSNSDVLGFFVKSMPPSLSELKVAPSFCFPFKIPDDPTASSLYPQFKNSNKGPATVSMLCDS